MQDVEMVDACCGFGCLDKHRLQHSADHSSHNLPQTETTLQTARHLSSQLLTSQFALWQRHDRVIALAWWWGGEFLGGFVRWNWWGNNPVSAEVSPPTSLGQQMILSRMRGLLVVILSDLHKLRPWSTLMHGQMTVPHTHTLAVATGADRPWHHHQPVPHSCQMGIQLAVFLSGTGLPIAKEIMRHIGHTRLWQAQTSASVSYLLV